MSEVEYPIGESVLRPRRELLRDGAPMAIGGRALAILSLLAERRGALVSKNELHNAVWPGMIVEDNTLQAQVSAVRKALGSDAPLLITVHGLGYRLSIEPGEDRTFEPASIAVLAFANLTGDPAQDYLADGMAEELIGMLARAPGLKVPARTSTFAYKGRDTDIRTIARELGVAMVLEGSVRAAGERIRVTAQLIEAASGYHLWSANFDRRFDDLFALQDEIAGAIAAKLCAQITPGPSRPRDLKDYHMFLQANVLVERPLDMAEAMALYRHVAVREPAFAPAWGRLATALLYSSSTGPLPIAALAEARACAQQAARLDPGLAIAPMVLGGLDALAGAWLAAEANFRTAQRLDPSDSHCHSVHGYYVLAACGHLERAQAAIETAFELAPASPLHSFGRAAMAGLRGDGALVLLNLQMAETLGMSADEPGVRAIKAAAAAHFGQWEEAAGHLTIVFPKHLRAAASPTAELFYRAQAGLADKSAASAAMRQLVDLVAADDELPRYQVAAGTMLQCQVQLGALDAAYDIADRIVAAWRATGQLPIIGLPQVWAFGMKRFRRDPRFQHFANTLGMFNYWQQHGPPDRHELIAGKLTCE